jgi:methionyl-tRNA formyltransferase
MDAASLERRIRAYDPWPGTFTIAIEDDKAPRLKIFPPVTPVDLDLGLGTISTQGGGLVVGCGGGAIRLESVQPEGGRRMSGDDYLRGRKPASFR